VRLALTAIALNVSMVNLPAALNAQVVNVAYLLGLVHAYPMMVVP
jgi:hypothetical protein